MEVDFIAQKGDKRMYCQTAYLLPDRQVVEREFRSLLSIPDNFPKYVVTMDQMKLGNREGIRHVQAWEFIE
jgi:predicted AAA+ superfamily ATPase